MYSQKTKLILLVMVAIAMVYFVTGGFQFTVDLGALALSGGILVALWRFFFRKGGTET